MPVENTPKEEHMQAGVLESSAKTFELDLQIVLDVPLGADMEACTTNDGCAATCASSCASQA
jgi:FxLD family lantipeptide